MADIQSDFAGSDAYLSALIAEVRAAPTTGTSLTAGRRGFFKLAGAAATGLVLGFHLGKPVWRPRQRAAATRR